MKYEEMLKLAKEKLPKVQSKSERFVVPKIQGHVEGNKTILINIFSIADLIARKLTSAMINEKMQSYVTTFVLCDQCSKPDTQLLNEEGKLIKKCTACGTKSLVQTKI